MSHGSKGQRGPTALAAVLLVLTACAKAMPPMEGKTAEPPLQQMVHTLLANQEAGRVRTVLGVAFVLAPVAVPLANGEVSLLPSTPDLEAALAQLQRRWRAGRQQPLPYEAFLTAFARLTEQRVRVGRAGGESLIRFAPTDEQGRFSLEGVPQGRWLLVADMSSPVSILLWAVPVEVGTEDPLPLFLTEASLLLEARKPAEAAPK
jgi:hypothetical protein